MLARIRNIAATQFHFQNKTHGLGTLSLTHPERGDMTLDAIEASSDNWVLWDPRTYSMHPWRSGQSSNRNP